MESTASAASSNPPRDSPFEGGQGDVKSTTLKTGIRRDQVEKARKKYIGLRKASDSDWFESWLDYLIIREQYSRQNQPQEPVMIGEKAYANIA